MPNRLWAALSEMVSEKNLYLGYYTFGSTFRNKSDENMLFFRYHVPRSWLKPAGNVMVVFEEWGGDPDWISLVQRTARTVCADIHEGQPAMDNWAGINSGRVSSAKAHLWCAPGHKITQIKFASYGAPQGTCGNYQEGSCHAHKSYDVPQQVFLQIMQIFISFIFAIELDTI